MSTNDAINSNDAKCMNSNYFHGEGCCFYVFALMVGLIVILFLLGFGCAEVDQGGEILGKGWEGS